MEYIEGRGLLSLERGFGFTIQRSELMFSVVGLRVVDGLGFIQRVEDAGSRLVWAQRICEWIQGTTSDVEKSSVRIMLDGMLAQVL